MSKTTHVLEIERLMVSRCAEANGALTYVPCAACWSGDVKLYAAHRSEEPTGRIGTFLQYWVVFEDKDEA